MTRGEEKRRGKGEEKVSGSFLPSFYLWLSAMQIDIDLASSLRLITTLTTTATVIVLKEMVPLKQRLST